jgi:hypothetical protein
MSTNFRFSLDGFRIGTTMASHSDTDHVYLTVKRGSDVLGPVHADTGDVNDGIVPVNLQISAEVDPETPILMAYQIINRGESEQQEQVNADVDTATSIAGVVTGVATVVFPPSAVAAAEILAGLRAAGGALSFITGKVNCDGLVLSDALVTTGAELARLTGATGSHTETRSYTGPETPHGCGSNAQYDVTWTISRWSGWSEVGGGGTTSLPLAATVFRERIYLFGVSTDGHEFVNSSSDGATWSGWSEVGGGGTTSLALSATVFRDRLYLFGVSTLGRLFGVSTPGREFVNSSSDGATWSGWNEVGGGGTTLLALAATVFSDRIYLFAVSTEGRDFVNSSFDGATWSGWTQVGGGGTTSLSLATTVFRDRLYLFGISTQGHEFVNSLSDAP